MSAGEVAAPAAAAAEVERPVERCGVPYTVTQIPRSNMAYIFKVLRTVTVEPVMFLYMICLYYLIPAANTLYLYKVGSLRMACYFDHYLIICTPAIIDP